MSKSKATWMSQPTVLDTLNGVNILSAYGWDWECVSYTQVAELMGDANGFRQLTPLLNAVASMCQENGWPNLCVFAVKAGDSYPKSWTKGPGAWRKQEILDEQQRVYDWLNSNYTRSLRLVK